MQGTALVAREGITNFTTLPSGCGKAAEYKGIWMVKVYFPSGAARRQEREQFYNSELTYVLIAASPHMIIGGDFNCVLIKNDSTDQLNYTIAFDGLIHGFELQDTWHTYPTRNGFSHYSATGTTRIERIYSRKELSTRKIMVETMAAAFTDHLTVILRMSVEVPIVRRGMGFWKMNISILDEEVFKEKLHQQ